MIRWFSIALSGLLVLLLALTLLLPTTTGAQISQPTQIHFECPSAEKASAVARDVGKGEIIPGVSPLPRGCSWVRGEKQAKIIKLVSPIHLEDGRTVWIGLVARYNQAPAFSAGHVEMNLM